MDSLAEVRAALPPWAWDTMTLANGLLLLAAVFVPLERLFARVPSAPGRPGWQRDVGWYFLNNLLLAHLVALPVLALLALLQAVAPQGLLPALAQWPDLMRFVVALMVAELGFYWGHRWVHANAWLWRFHAVHHGATQLDWLVNVRAHPLDMLVVRLCGLLPLVPLGLVQPASGRLDWVPLGVATVSTLWGYVIHANLRWRLGWVEYLIATPHFHHGHHEWSGDARARNFAPSLPVVDWIFGTLRGPERAWPARYGVADPVAPALIDQLFAPFLGPWRPRETPQQPPHA